MNQRMHKSILRACQEHNLKHGIKLFEQGWLGIEEFRDAFGNRKKKPWVFEANSVGTLCYALYLNKATPRETLAAVKEVL